MRRHPGTRIIARRLKAPREPTFSGGHWRLSALRSPCWHWTGGWAPAAWPFGWGRLSPEAFQRCSGDLYSLQTSSYLSGNPPRRPLGMTPTLCRGPAESMPPWGKDSPLRTQIKRSVFKSSGVAVPCEQTCKGPCSPPVNNSPSPWWHTWREGQRIST